MSNHSNAKWRKWKTDNTLRENLSQAKKFGKKINITEQAIEKVEIVEISTHSKIENQNIHLMHQQLLQYSRDQNDNNEVAFIITNGRPIIIKGSQTEVDFNSNPLAVRVFKENSNVIVLHNHPGQSGFSMNDIRVFLQTDALKTLTIVTNKGKVKYLSKTEKFDYFNVVKKLKEYNFSTKNMDKVLKKLYDVGVESKLR